MAVRAFSINRGELALLQTRTDQWRPGQDIAGVIIEPATDGSGPLTGTRVVALVEHAGWAELAAVPTARMSPLPDEVSVEQAAALPLAGLAALRTLRLGSDLLGRRVLVTGASFGTGQGCRGEEDPVMIVKVRSADLRAQDGDLMTHDDDLHVPAS